VSPRDALFEPNTRGSASDGDGLGLFLATLILDRYDGDIQLTGTATFELWVATDGSEV
jgi:signal transduction histidine kinase